MSNRIVDINRRGAYLYCEGRVYAGLILPELIDLSSRSKFVLEEAYEERLEVLNLNEILH